VGTPDGTNGVARTLQQRQVSACSRQPTTPAPALHHTRLVLFPRSTTSWKEKAREVSQQWRPQTTDSRRRNTKNSRSGLWASGQRSAVHGNASKRWSSRQPHAVTASLLLLVVYCRQTLMKSDNDDDDNGELTTTEMPMPMPRQNTKSETTSSSCLL